MTTTYLILLIGDENRWESSTPDQRATTYSRHGDFLQALEAGGHRVTGGAELAPSRDAVQLRLAGHEPVQTTGPYAETVEQLGGFYQVETDDLDGLITCSRLLLDDDGAIEIRKALPGPE